MEPTISPSPRSRRLCAALATALFGLPAVAAAATPQVPPAQPPSQTSPQTLPSALPPTTAPSTGFVLRGVRFSGNTVLTDAQLQQLVSPRIGQRVTLDDLTAIAKQITAMYQARGYAFVQALVPVQEVIDGIVDVSVVEGKLGKVTLSIAPGVPVGADRLRAMLAPLQAGQPLNAREYERVMLLISDLPGVKAQSALQAGVAPGTTDLTVQIAPAPRTNWSVGLDNFGTREAGTLRLGGSMRINSPFGIGDNLDARALVSEHSNTVFGRLSYEAPLGTEGWRLGGGAARVNYSLGGAFTPLDALGTADIYDLSATVPVVRQRAQNLFLRFFTDDKRLTDELRAVGFISHKRVRGAGIGWAWEKRDGWLGGGYWSSNGAFYLGSLDLRDPANRAFDEGPFGPHTQGDFTKLTFKVSRLQAVAPKVTFYLALGGQATDHNLDSSEKFSLGGNNAVRAYPVGEVLVDDGWLATAELRYAVRKDLTGFVFYDAGHGRQLHHPGVLPSAGNARSLRGPGLGVSYAMPGNFSLDASVAWRTTAPAVTSGGDKDPRVFFNLQKFF